MRKRLLEQASESVAGQRGPSPASFRWRGKDVSRMEGFSDAVFGFALTLLVVSLEVPKNYNQLAASMRGFLAFGVCFCLLSFVWYEHYVFFRQYGLKDTLTLVLNLILLFCVMVYVYPLKFLFSFLVSLLLGVMPMDGGKPVIRVDQFPSLLMFYGAGYVTVYTVFVLMYLNAYRQRNLLELTDLERFDTKAQIGSQLILITIGLTSIGLASLRTPRTVLAAGLIYFGIGFAMAIYWTASGTRRRRLEAPGASPPPKRRAVADSDRKS